MLNSTCQKVQQHLPTLPDADAAAFMSAYQAFNGSGSEDAVMAAARKLLGYAPLQTFLTLPDSFGAGGLDASMVLCAVLTLGTPLALSEFAANSTQNEALVTQLFQDPMLMRDMLVAGGPANNAFGQAMAIYSKIHQASAVLRRTPRAPRAAGTPWDDRNQSTILHRVALGTALGHAVPIHHRYVNADRPNDTVVDPVERYLHYEQAYLAGDLDPAMEVLTAFECAWTTNTDASSEDLVWVRTTLENYHPDNIAMDYDWRYSRAVRTDVAYGDPQCEQLPGVCSGTYAQIPAAGGECGPRAFFGRFVRKAFGLPTWGVTQPGHAAMSCWAPQGWHILLGAAWEFSWWGSRGGDDFYLETQCRELRPDYQKVLRGSWGALARGDEPVDPRWGPRSPSSYGKGGLWSALMLYAKKVAVNDTTPPTRPVGPSVVPTKVAALLARWNKPEPTPSITVRADGTIIVPAPALTFKNRSASVSVMKSFDEGEQLLHNGGDYTDPSASSIGYDVVVNETRTYYLTANISTWHMNTDLMVTSNTSSTPVQLPVFYTLGYWNETQAVEVKLLQGSNRLIFARSRTRELAIKQFYLYTTKPNVPAPPSNFTPSPQPTPSSYIEVPANTDCEKQGITEVPEQFCNLACESLGLKYTGGKPRMNMTGCFALTTGEWAGDCNYNTNRSATICDDPPCTVFGSVTRQICIRS